MSSTLVGSALTFLYDPEPVEGEFRNDNAHLTSLHACPAVASAKAEAALRIVGKANGKMWRAELKI